MKTAIIILLFVFVVVYIISVFIARRKIEKYLQILDEGIDSSDDLGEFEKEIWKIFMRNLYGKGVLRIREERIRRYKNRRNI